MTWILFLDSVSTTAFFFTGTARPICLAGLENNPTDIKQTAMVSGWGRFSDTTPGLSRYLRYVDQLDLLSHSQCEEYWGNLNEGVGCFDTTGGRGSCNGDSGGPLCIFSIEQFHYVQIGIVSMGSSFGCEIGVPAGFTEVAKYSKWISSITGLKHL